MARIESWYNQDLQEAVKVHYLDGNVFSADNAGNLIGVNVFDGGSPASLSGSVSGSVIRSDGGMVSIEGVLSSNRAYVILPQAAYAIPGPISIVIKITSGTDITTLCAVVANVYTASTDMPIDPGQIIPSIEELIEAIEAAVATIPADYSELNSYVYGKDIIDHTQIEDGKWVDMTNGIVKNWGSDPDPFCVTPMLSVAPNDVLILAGSYSGSQGAFYDANGNYVSGFLSNTDTMVVVPDTSTIRYMRWCSLQANKANMAVKREKNQSGYKWAFDFNAGNNLIVNWTDGKYVHYYDGTLANNSDFCVTDYIRVAPGSLIYVSGASSEGSQVAFYNGSKTYVSGIDSEGAATILVPNTSTIRYMRWCTSLTNKSSASLRHYQSDGGLCIVVSKNGDGDYTSLTAAVAAASNGDIIYVKKGTYSNEAAKAWGKNISIIGEDKYQTILTNNYNDYERPVLEMDIGYLANLTLYAYDDGATPGQYGAGYGLHIEHNSMANGKFFAKDVVFKSDLWAGAGIGLRPGCYAYFEDCYFWSSSECGIFYHDCATGAVGVQHIQFTNCTFFTVFGEYSMRINSQKWTGSTVYNTFINCTVANSAGTTPKIDASHASSYTGDATGPIGDFYKLINFYKGHENYGNNVPDLNFWDNGITVYPKMGYLSGATNVISDLNDAQPNTMYLINCSSSSQLPAHSPSTGLLTFYVLTVNTTFYSGNTYYVDKMQYAIDKETFEPKFVREYVDSWSSWSAIPSGGGSITVVDNLNSTSATDALSANQGKVLNDKYTNFAVGTYSQVASYNDLKTLLNNTVSAMSNFEVRNIMFNCTSSFETFGTALWIAVLTKNANTYFSALCYPVNKTGMLKVVRNQGGTWYIEDYALNSDLNAILSGSTAYIDDCDNAAPKTICKTGPSTLHSPHSYSVVFTYSPTTGLEYRGQIGIDVTSGILYSRGRRDNGVWTDWRELATLQKSSITLSIPSGWTISANESYKKGGFVYATGLLTADSAVTGASLDFGIVVPSGYRPSKPVNFSAFNHNTNEPMWGIINEDGRLCIYRTVTTSLTKIDFTVMYPV